MGHGFEDGKCPQCQEPMERHPKTCIGLFGNTSEGPHWLCCDCNVEAFPDGHWRWGR